VYGGATYAIAAGNTTNKYVYWVAGASSYSTSATHPTSGFTIAINTAGVHTLVWNNSANMVIGTAYIADAAITNAKIGSLAVDTGNIAALAVTDAKIASIAAGKISSGSIPTTYTDAKCTNALADQTSANTAADTAKVQGYTLIEGGYIKSDYITADNIDTGTLTGRVVRTAASGQRAVIDSVDNTLKLYDAGGDLRVLIDDDASGYVTVVGDNGELTIIGQAGMMYWYDSSSNMIIQMGTNISGEAGIYIQKNSSSVILANTAGSGYSGLYADSNGVIHIGTTGYVNAVGGYKVNGTAGITGTCTVKVTGVDKTLTITNGIITGLA
jgi:hypothetical protein